METPVLRGWIPLGTGAGEDASAILGREGGDRLCCTRGSGSYVKIFQYAVSEIHDKGSLLGSAVTLTGTSHACKTPNEELQFDPLIPQFNGEDEGLALRMLKLNVAQDILGKSAPKKGVELGGGGVFLEKTPHLLHVGRRNFINQV